MRVAQDFLWVDHFFQHAPVNRVPALLRAPVRDPADPASTKSDASARASTAPPEKVEQAPAPNPFGAVFMPGMEALGITQHVVRPGDTVWKFLDESGAFRASHDVDANRLVNAYLAGTPSLDTRAFGTRPANPPAAVREIQPGRTVTLLDTNRLACLEQQRSQLADLEAAHVATDSQATRRDGLRTELVATVYQELDYAGTQQAVPAPERLAESIRMRAPDDAEFKSAVDDAVALYKQTLASQGRTDEQFGAIARHAAQGDFAAVREATRQQIVDLAGDSVGTVALGKMTARGSVFMTHAGGDPRFAAAVQQGIKDARQTVLVDRPADAIVADYKKSGAAAAMKALRESTDPQTMTPGQVGQLMADSRVQGVIKSTVSDVARWSDPRGGPGRVMLDLASACQHAVYSDLGGTGAGQLGLGRQAVDQIAGYMVDQSQNPPRDSANSLFGYPYRIQGLFSDMASQGDLALPLALGAKAAHSSNPAIGTAAIDGVRMGLDALASSVDELNKKVKEHAAFLTVPAREWGGAGTPAEQADSLQKLLARNPQEARRLADDGQELLRMQETVASAKSAIEAYSGSLKGTEGFDTAVRQQDYGPGAYFWSAAKSKSVTAAFASVPKPVTQAAESGSATNSLWFQRSLRKVVEIAGKSYIGGLGAGEKSLLSPGATQVVQNVWKRGNKSLGAVLYFQNAAFELGEFGENTARGALFNGFVNGASGIRQELAGVSYALSAGIPSGALASVRPGSGATPLARSYEKLAANIDALALSDGAKFTMKQGLRLVLQDTSDFASAILAVVSAGVAFEEGKNLQGVGQSLNALGYTLMLTGAGIDEAVFAADATLLGLGATWWTGIGAVLVLAGSAIYTGAEAHEHSHEFDGAGRQWLESMGVKPDIADVLARHASSFNGDAPTAGPFLTEYFRQNKLSQQHMVNWFNSLTPKQADEMASAIKSFGDEWKKHPMSEDVRRFDDALLQYGLMPPDVQLVAANP